MSALSSGDLLGGKYRIERLLGRGGMGEVYLAENTALGRKVAIKVLRSRGDGDDGPDPELLARFRAEARTAAAIGHPGIVDVLDLGATDDGIEFIVMEFLDGESLGDRLERSSRLGVAEIVRIGGELLDALAAAHDAGVVHRDLKPDNVFLVARPVRGTKILDFGISKLTRAEDAALTSTGRIMGTPLYMSPEQGRGDRVASPTDVYSAGAVLYRALSGETPVSGSSINEVITNLATVPPVPLAGVCPNLPRPLTDAVDKMIARLPEMRPTARAAASALRAAASGLGPVADGAALTAPRADGVAVTAPRAGEAPTVALQSTLGATASELGLAPTDPARASSSARSSRLFLALALSFAFLVTAALAFILIRPNKSRSSVRAAIDAAHVESSTPPIDATPIDAAPEPIDASIDASVDAGIDAPKVRRRRPDAGAGVNVDDIKE